MIFDHVVYDLTYVFHVPFSVLPAYFDWEVRTLIRIGVVLSFVLLCGISCSFSRSNLVRGLKLAGVALLLTFVTKILDLVQGDGDRFIIVFGVLHMLAVSILIYALLEKVASGKAFLFIGIVLAAIGVYFNMVLYYAPQGLEALSILVPLRGGVYSADYFSLLPGAGFLLIGAFLGPLIYGEKKSRFPLKGEARLTRPFMFAGRHALIFYLGHQPLVLGVLSLIFLILRAL
jgi:uncharacterized membrane protein